MASLDFSIRLWIQVRVNAGETDPNGGNAERAVQSWYRRRAAASGEGAEAAPRERSREGGRNCSYERIRPQKVIQSIRFVMLRKNDAWRRWRRTDTIRFSSLRARSFGWPNSYAFTKAMGEMLIGESRGDLPLVIIRPTIIEATLADPFPGWIEGFR